MPASKNKPNPILGRARDRGLDRVVIHRVEHRVDVLHVSEREGLRSTPPLRAEEAAYTHLGKLPLESVEVLAHQARIFLLGICRSKNGAKGRPSDSGLPAEQGPAAGRGPTFEAAFGYNLTPPGLK